jgi:hypothetical protein
MKEKSTERKEALIWTVVCVILLVISWFAFGGEGGEPLFKIGIR